jgi:hypothetical protein
MISRISGTTYNDLENYQVCSGTSYNNDLERSRFVPEQVTMIQRSIRFVPEQFTIMISRIIRFVPEQVIMN